MRRKEMTKLPCAPLHVDLLDESKSHLIFLMMIKINNIAASPHPPNCAPWLKITLKINLKSLSKLNPGGTAISAQSQRLHSLNNFAGDDEITSY